MQKYEYELDLEKFNSQEFVATIFSNSIKYINNKIWSGLDRDCVVAWLKNFETEKEKYLAACLLDSMIYRSDEQVNSLLQYLLDVTLPNQIYKIDSAKGLDFHSKLFRNPSCKYKFIAPVDHGTSSGNLILGKLKNRFRVSEKNIIDIDYLENNNICEILIVVDDFVGSGNQFCSYIKDNNLQAKIKAIPTIFIPLIGSENGINNINNQFSHILVEPVETITDEHNFFNKFKNRCGKNYYEKFMKSKLKINIPCNKFLFGYNEMALCVLFQGKIPNNTLPIFNWQSSPDGWCHMSEVK